MIISLRCQATAVFALVMFAAIAHAQSNEPFGLHTVPVTSGPLADAWRAQQARLKTDRETIGRCASDRAQCTAGTLRFLQLRDEARERQGRDRLTHINGAVNLSIRFANDTETFAGALDTLERGEGDCAGIAMVKYVILLEAGMAQDDLRLAIVQQPRAQAEFHMILLAHDSGQWLILDNRTMLLIEATDRTDYRPRYSFDHSGMREFPLPPPAKIAIACNAVSPS